MRTTKPYCTIPGTDLHPFSICLGTGDLGSTVDRENSFKLYDAYVERGGNFLDTAKVYADWLPGERSVSEKTIGRWMKLRGNRDKLIIGTKGAHPDLANMHIPRLSRQEIEFDLNASLKHLGTDYVDLYWLHRDDPQHPVEDILETLNAQVKEGKVRYFGCSNWRVSCLKAAQEYAKEHGLQGFVADQPLWNLAVIDYQLIGDPTIVVMDKELKEYHQQSGLAAIPFSATANGFFNKMEKGALNNLSPLQQKMYGSPENIHRFERASKLATESSCSITQVVLSYLLSQPFVTIPIIGPKRRDQLHESLSAASVRLDPGELSFLENG